MLDSCFTFFSQLISKKPRREIKHLCNEHRNIPRKNAIKCTLFTFSQEKKKKCRSDKTKSLSYNLEEKFDLIKYSTMK